MKLQPSPQLRNSLQGYNIFFQSLPKHDGPYTSTPWQLAVQLAKSNKVFFLDHPYTFLDLLTGFFKAPILKRLRAYWSNVSFRKQEVDVILSPFVWPINFLPKGKLYEFFSRLNHHIVARRVNRFFKQNNVDSILYINSFNFYFPSLARYLKASVSLNVYHCIDPMVKAFTIKHGLYLQDRAARDADMIISTAPALQRNFASKGYSKNYLVPNAANFELFNRAVKEQAIHPKVAPIPGKIMGYLGNIERRIDYQLLLKALERLPDWHLVLAGPVERQYVPVEIFNHKRIHFTGPVPLKEAPSVVRRFDVAIIPFKCDEASRGIFPLKLFEYMAAAKPVVSTNFNPDILQDLSFTVQTADNDQQFADFVILAYVTDTKQKREKRIHIASQNNWEKRAQLFSNYIAHELESKHRLPYVA